MLTINFIVFDFIILSDLNSCPNNLDKILLIGNFLVDCLICLNISLIAQEILKSSLPGWILINLQSSSCSIDFFYFYFVVNISVALSIFIYFYCGIIVLKMWVDPITYNFITLYCVWMLCPSNKLIIFVSTDCSFVKMTSYCLNPSLVLNV